MAWLCFNDALPFCRQPPRRQRPVGCSCPQKGASDKMYSASMLKSRSLLRGTTSTVSLLNGKRWPRSRSRHRFARPQYLLGRHVDLEGHVCF